MAKQTNRVAWGMAAVLALALLIGVLALGATYSRQKPGQLAPFILLAPQV